MDTDDEDNGGRWWEGGTSRRRNTSMPPFFQERYLLGVAHSCSSGIELKFTLSGENYTY